MSLRTRVLRLVEIVLRVPPLFVIDEILKVGIGDPPEYIQYDLTDSEGFGGIKASQNGTAPLTYDPTFYKLVLTALIRIVLCVIGE